MPSTVNDGSVSLTPDDRFGLPAESLRRFTALVHNSIDGATDGDLKVWVAPLTPGPLLREPLACEDTRHEGAPRDAVKLPADARAFVVLPLRDPEGGALDDDKGSGGELALCIASPSPRPWPPAAITALGAVAATAAAELQLRVSLARRERISTQLTKYPLHDPVTELGNRELFLDRVGQALMRYARSPEKHMAVMSLSVNQSDDIENSFGYDAVDEMLRELGRRLKIVVRNVDSAARLAGDEFGVLLEALRDNSDAARVANRMHDALRKPIKTTWGDFLVTANIGIMLSEKGLDSPARLIQLAGLARDRARATGAPYEMFDPEMQQRAQARLQSEMELRRAVEEHEFELYYQPIVDLATGRIAKAEALVRWRHPKRGITLASDFIPLAEQTGLIVPMGWAILSEGCDQIEEWVVRSRHELSVSININAAHLTHATLLDRVRSEMQAHGLGKGSLSVEVTEGILIGDQAKAKAVLNELRALGVGVHLDDFGTGYSSLHYLHELPLDAIKIDRSFIQHMESRESDAALVVTIRDLARRMGVPVIAEGVETKEQLARLRELKCEYAQGYLFSKPLPRDEMAELLKKDPRW